MGDIKEYLDSLSDKITYLNISNKSLSEIPDLSRFTNLKILDFSHNNIATLPESLPNSLENLYCNFNPLIKLNNLPSNLIGLFCSDCKLIELPENLPNSLIHLYCNNNNLDYLPECISKLSKQMAHLHCVNNNLKILPFIIGNSYLDMNFAQNPCIYDIYIKLRRDDIPIYINYIDNLPINTCEYICKKNYELLIEK